MELENTTGYEIVQKQGQRIFGGPPPGWCGPSPGRGTEIYCYKIPRDCFEDELVPVFASVGRIYELRLMLEFSGTNRTYCYVRYCRAEDAKEAVRKLDNFKIRPRNALSVTFSVDNRQLSARLIPPLQSVKQEQELMNELSGLGVEGVCRVILCNGEWLKLEFESHRFAALARRRLVPGNCSLWNEATVKQVEWAQTEGMEKMASSGERSLYVKNIPSFVSYSKLVDLFNRLSNNHVETVVRAGNLVLVTLNNIKAVEMLKMRCIGLYVGGFKVEVGEWKNKATKRLDLVLRPCTLSQHSPQQELVNLCLRQGWGCPVFSLIGCRLNSASLFKEFQVRLVV